MIVTRVQDGIAVVILDRPDHHNALIPELAEQLIDHLRAAAEHGRALVLTASGPTFCSGADVGWLAAAADPALAIAELVAIHHRVITTLLDMPVPVIAAVNGAVAGSGLGLALAADFRIAAETATFRSSYMPLGLTLDGGASVFLQQTIGRSRAIELLLTDRPIDAARAQQWGLVNDLAPAGQELQRAVELARALAQMPAYALRSTRALLDIENIRNQLQRESVSIRTAARGHWFRQALRRSAADVEPIADHSDGERSPGR